jgi:adenine-specific DNA-methyltransferase
MAKIEDLVKRISDEKLRDEIAAEVRELKKHKQFGLVFEEHLPEMLRLPKVAIRVGNLVVQRDAPGNELWRVIAIKGKNATCRQPINPRKYDEERTAEVPLGELVLVVSFGEPIYPVLTPVDRIARAVDKPWHIVINADNYHALQLLLYASERKVDAIYIDPPYNTGARDWKYNNDYVDKNDPWRHSKWLSMLKRRLLMAKRLMNPADSVLIVTIDEKECHHLGMLLDSIFPAARIQMVSTLINPASVAREGSFGRNDEYVFFVMIGAAAPQRVRLNREWVSAKGRTHTGNLRWDLLRRSGPGSSRKDSPGCFYPIYVNPDGPVVAEIAEAIPKGDSTPKPRKGCVAVLPIRKNGSEGRWQWTPVTIRKRLTQGRVRITGSKADGFVVSILKDGEYAKVTRGEFEVSGRRSDGSLIVDDIEFNEVLAIPGSQWRISSHDATQYGSRLLADLIPNRQFPFPKSLYAVEDALRFFVGHKPEALILDFFGGSGTTTHAVARLNKQDGGNRRSILVTNNEVSVDEAESLRLKGFEPGDAEWEALGIFEYVTRPRLASAFTGITPEGEAVRGNYKFTDEFPIADGFAENIEFFRLEFLEPTQVERGDAFEGILPILWLMAGAIGERESRRGATPWYMAKHSPFAVLIQETKFNDFEEKLRERKDITHIFLVTDSEDNFALLRRELGRKYHCVQLYKSYLENFRINTVDRQAAGMELE